MAYLKHKSPTPRIIHLVKRLFQNEKLHVKKIAEAYEVSARTIHRDLKQIHEIIPLNSINGEWQLAQESLDSFDPGLNHLLLSSFAHNLQIEAECLAKENLSTELVSFGIEYKNLPKQLGEKIATSILREVKASFVYEKADGSSERCVDPIKIYTENGRWYLIARDYKDDRVKYFNLSKIKRYQPLNEPNTLTEAMRKEADEMKSIWSSTNNEVIKVRLYIRPEIADYIRDIHLHKSQVIFDEHHDGGLEVHYEITHMLELLPQIKYWLPRIHVLEPKWLWEELMRDLEMYRDSDERIQHS